MISSRSKLSLVAAPFAITSAVLFCLSTTVDGGQDAYLIRLAFWIIGFGVLSCLVAWCVHLVQTLKLELAATKDRLAAADRRADAADRRADDVEERVGRLEDELACRELAKKLLSGEDTALLRTLLHVDD